MTTFDAPSREQVCSRRERSNTPLQALALMNDIQHMEAARNFAQRILLEGGTTTDQRLSFAFPPCERTLSNRHRGSHHRECSRSAPRPLWQRLGRRAKLITFGDSKPDPKVKADELAAWTLVGNLLLNLDEALNQ